MLACWVTPSGVFLEDLPAQHTAAHSAGAASEQSRNLSPAGEDP
jgi:hypothetical protein